MTRRSNRSATPTGAILCVTVGSLLGILYLGILGRYGIPWWIAYLVYVLAVISAFLIWAGMLRGEQ